MALLSSSLFIRMPFLAVLEVTSVGDSQTSNRRPAMQPPLFALILDLHLGQAESAGKSFFNSKARTGVSDCAGRNSGVWQVILQKRNQMLTKDTNLPPFLSLHSIAATRGDGLDPRLLILFIRLAAGVDESLAEFAEPPMGCELKSGQK
jgi:hypothetical protein